MRRRCSCTQAGEQKVLAFLGHSACRWVGWVGGWVCRIRARRRARGCRRKAHVARQAP